MGLLGPMGHKGPWAQSHLASHGSCECKTLAGIVLRHTSRRMAVSPPHPSLQIREGRFLLSLTSVVAGADWRYTRQRRFRLEVYNSRESLCCTTSWRSVRATIPCFYEGLSSVLRRQTKQFPPPLGKNVLGLSDWPEPLKLRSRVLPWKNVC